MKIYSIRFDRMVNQELTIPADIVANIDTYDGEMRVVHTDGSVILVLPGETNPIAMLLDVPPPKPAADQLTDEDLTAAPTPPEA